MIERLENYISSNKPKNSKLWRWLSFLLTFVMIIYLAYEFILGDLRFNRINWRAYSGTILVILGIYLFSLILQFFVWTRIILFHRQSTWQDLNIYARTVLMRSLPGGAWHWLGRISMYSDGTDVPARIIVLGNFLEWVLFILSGVGIFFLSLPTPGLGTFLGLLALCIGLALTLTWQPTIRKWPIRLAEGSLWIAIYCLAWILGSTILYLIVKGIVTTGKLSILEAINAWAFTGSLGMAVAIFPSSLGVREISLVWLLQAKLTSSVALLVALMLRVLYTLADVIWGTLGWVGSYIMLRKK